MKKLILYSYFRSSASYRVRIALNIKNLEYEYRSVHLLKKEQFSDQYKTLNPAEKVPTLVDGEFVLSESMAIIDYLDNAFGGTKLFPQNPKERAQILRFCEVINSGVQPLGNLKVLQYVEQICAGQPQIREQWLRYWVGSGMQTLEKLLESSSGKYSFGDQVTAADVFLIPQVFTAKRFKIDLSACPHVMRIAENCEKIEAFAKAHPSQQPDFEA